MSVLVDEEEGAGPGPGGERQQADVEKQQTPQVSEVLNLSLQGEGSPDGEEEGPLQFLFPVPREERGDPHLTAEEGFPVQ